MPSPVTKFLGGLPPSPQPTPAAESDCPDELRRTLGLYKGLVEVASLINGITEYRSLLTAILEVARRVIGAEGASLILHDAEADVLRLAVARSPLSEDMLRPNTLVPRASIAGWVWEQNQTLNVPDAYLEPRFSRDMDMRTGYRTRAILCVPLPGGERPAGVLQVLNAVGKDCFNDQDREAFEAYAQLAATAMEKLRMLEEEKDRARFERELGIAQDIQLSFLPRHLPMRPDLAFAADYHPAREVGGDFYDVFEISPDEIYFVIGDVASKGVPAALLMAQSLSLLRLIISHGLDPADAMQRWNRKLSERLVRGYFVTAMLGRITPSLGMIEIASAGHPPPVRVSADGAAAEVEMPAGPPLGIRARRDAVYPQHHLEMQPCEWLMFYTDGLNESHSPASELLGTEAITARLARKFATAQAIVDELRALEASHRGAERAPHDDMTLLVMGLPSGATGVVSPPVEAAEMADRAVEFTSDPALLRGVRRKAREFLREFAPELAEDAEFLVLGLDEACTNVIRHAYKGEAGRPILLRMECDAREVRFLLRDHAEPTPCCQETSGRALEDVKPGGLGLHLMRKIFDRVDWTAQPDGNELLLAKTRPV